jgi:excisionase family DNA binding protein
MAALPEGQEIFTLPEVAKFLRITRKTALDLVQSGDLQAFRVKRHWRVTREALENFIANRNRPEGIDGTMC